MSIIQRLRLFRHGLLNNNRTSIANSKDAISTNDSAVSNDVIKKRKTAKDEKSTNSDIPQNGTTKEILKHYDRFHIEKMLDFIPSKLLIRRNSVSNELYLFDYDVGKQIVDSYEPCLSKDPCRIFEANAGLGAITKNLLSHGVQNVHILEPNTKFIPLLVDLQQKYVDKISIQNTDLFSIWKLAFLDKQDNGNRIAKVFKSLPRLRWEEGEGLKFIGILPNVSFIKYIILDIVRQSGISAFGRPVLYLTMPPSVWLRLTTSADDRTGDYKATTSMFQLLFDYKLIGEVPRKAFLPWPSTSVIKSNSVTAQRRKLDSQVMYVTRLEAKKNLFIDVIDHSYIQPFWWFLQHHLNTRATRVIPQLEALAPGCGPRLISRNINIFTRFEDLTPEELVDLFMNFTTWDGYQSTFLPAMENSVQKMEQMLY